MIENEIEKIDYLLDQEIQRVQTQLQNKKSLDYSLIDNDLVSIYNEMLTFSYIMKIWLLNGLTDVLEDPADLLTTVKMQFENILHLLNYSGLKVNDTLVTSPQIQHFYRRDQVI